MAWHEAEAVNAMSDCVRESDQQLAFEKGLSPPTHRSITVDNFSNWNYVQYLRRTCNSLCPIAATSSSFCRVPRYGATHSCMPSNSGFVARPIKPQTGAYDNLFGDDCAGPYSWCGEVDLGGHIPAIVPAETGLCEVFDYITCGDGTWRVTIEVGADRFNVCGF